MIKSKKLSSLVAASLILAGGSLLGVQTVSAQVTDQQFNEVVQGVNANTQKINNIESQLSASKDYSSDIAANKQTIADETSARQKDVSSLQTNINNEQGARVEADNNLQNNLNKAVNAQAGINDTLTKAVTNNSKAIVANAEAAKNLEKHLNETDGRVDKANAEIQTNAGNIAQSQKDIAGIQDTLKNANAFASADATKAANEAAKKANTVADGLKDRVDLISNNQNVTSESDLIKKDQSVGQNLTNVDTALHKEIAARIGADAAQDKRINKTAENLAGLNKNVSDGFTALSKVDQAEATARAAKDTEHDTAIKANTDAINKEVQDRTKAVADEADARTKAVADEAKARESGDNALQNQIKKESAARQADISRLDNKIHDVSKEVDTVGALSMAMSGLHPLSYDEGDARFQLSAAVGTYDGTEALALGGFYHFNRDSMLSVGVATDLGADEHRMGANVGYTRRIGQGGHVSRPSEGTVSDIMKDIKNLEQKQAKLEQENEQLKQQLAALKK